MLRAVMTTAALLVVVLLLRPVMLPSMLRVRLQELP